MSVIGGTYASHPDNGYRSYDNLSPTALDSAIQIASLRYRWHPTNRALISQLAEAYSAKKETDTAVIYWDKLIKLQLKNDSLFYRKALALYDGGKYDSAYAAIQHSIDLSPDRIDYLSFSALTSYHLQHDNTALTLCKKILSQNPHNINARLLYGIILRDENDLAGAMGKFNECLKIDPANTDALIHRAEIYVLQKDYNNALKDYTAARADLSDNADVINNIGICYYQSGSYQRSIVFFKKAIVLNATNPESKFNMGISYYKLNDFDTASLDIKTASAIWDTCYGDSCHGYFLDAIYYLGMCYKKAGDLSAAKKHFELLQKEGYPRDLSLEISHINYALFISQSWYYIAAVLLLLIAISIAAFIAIRRR